MKEDVEGHMSEDYRWTEIYRRMDKVERKADQVPVIAHDVKDIKEDLNELRSETSSLRRALYTTALSVVGAAVIFALTANAIFK